MLFNTVYYIKVVTVTGFLLSVNYLQQFSDSFTLTLQLFIHYKYLFQQFYSFQLTFQGVIHYI